MTPEIKSPGDSHQIDSIKKLIVVEDNIDILCEYEEVLDIYGISAIYESNPIEALYKIISSPEITVVATDLLMKGMDGIQLMEKIRQSIPPSRNLNFIILTGVAHVPEKIIGPDTVVLKKPFEIPLLIEAIRSALDNTKPRRS